MPCALSHTPWVISPSYLSVRGTMVITRCRYIPKHTAKNPPPAPFLFKLIPETALLRGGDFLVFSLEFHHRKNILSPWPPLITSTVCSLLLMPLTLDYDTPCFCFEKHYTTSWVGKAIDGSISTVAWQHHHDPPSRYFCIS